MRGNGPMISLVLMVALVAFAAGAAAAVFLTLFIAIRRGDRPDRILGNPNAPLDAAARAVLGSRTWPNTPVYYPGPDDD